MSALVKIPLDLFINLCNRTDLLPNFTQQLISVERLPRPSTVVSTILAGSMSRLLQSTHFQTIKFTKGHCLSYLVARNCGPNAEMNSWHRIPSIFKLIHLKIHYKFSFFKYNLTQSGQRSPLIYTAAFILLQAVFPYYDSHQFPSFLPHTLGYEIQGNVKSPL